MFGMCFVDAFSVRLTDVDVDEEDCKGLVDIFKRSGISGRFRDSALFFSFVFSPIFAQISFIFEPPVEPPILAQISFMFVPLANTSCLRIVGFIKDIGTASREGGTE